MEFPGLKKPGQFLFIPSSQQILILNVPKFPPQKNSTTSPEARRCTRTSTGVEVGATPEDDRVNVDSTWLGRYIWGCPCHACQFHHPNGILNGSLKPKFWVRMVSDVFFFRMNFPPPEIEKFGDGFLWGNQVN